MSTIDDAKTRASATYNAAADHYDDPANAFWDRFGRGTIERLRLEPGARVLDVCCGAGASAIPAAEAVGPGGSVVGVDLAENLLGLARKKAAARKLRNVTFRRGDLLALGVGPEFDAVVCVFGIFFVPDMAAAARSLRGAVRPGGRLAITTWGPRLFEPLNTAFWNAVRDVRPDLYKGFNPWDRVCDPPALRVILHEAGIERADVVAEIGEHPIAAPEAWWSLVLGTGYRATIDLLDERQREHVREHNAELIRRGGIQSIETNVVYAVATIGAPSP